MLINYNILFICYIFSVSESFFFFSYMIFIITTQITLLFANLRINYVILILKCLQMQGFYTYFHLDCGLYYYHKNEFPCGRWVFNPFATRMKKTHHMTFNLIQRIY